MNKQDCLKPPVRNSGGDEPGKRAKGKNLAWMEHTRLERGNPVRIYEGRAFHLKGGTVGIKTNGA